MDRALWLLLGLRLGAWLRRLGRMLRTVRGILLFVVGGAFVGLWLFSLLWQASPPTAEHLAHLRHYGPLVLVGLFVVTLLFSTDERAITFTPAEVNLLFPGPFTRRQLLAYKIVGASFGALLSALFMALFLRQHVGFFLAGVVGLTLTLLLMQFVGMLLALLANVVGAQAYSRRRKLVVVVLAGVLAVAVYQAGVDILGRDWQDLLTGVEHSAVVQALLAPLGWFVNTITAERLWPDLVQWSALALLVDVVMVLLVFAVDAHYLETAAAASEKLYARVERARRSGAAAVNLPRSGRVRFSLPALPIWGGIRPLAWRQLSTAVRSFWPLVVLLLLFACLNVPLLLQRPRPGLSVTPASLVAGLLGILTLFVAPLVPFDFRADLDRMDVLKALPLPAWRVAVGQLLTPVLLITLVQVSLLIVMQLVGRVDSKLLATGPFFVPVNLLLFGIENLFFLWFPTRTAVTPGDFQALGRSMLLWMAKAFTLMLTLGGAALAGLAAYVLTGRSWIAALSVAWLVVTAVAVAMVPLVALAFRHFDVAADVPP